MDLQLHVLRDLDRYYAGTRIYKHILTHYNGPKPTEYFPRN